MTRAESILEKAYRYDPSDYTGGQTIRMQPSAYGYAMKPDDMSAARRMAKITLDQQAARARQREIDKIGSDTKEIRLRLMQKYGRK